MITEFQANAKTKVNGFDVAMMSNSITEKIRVRTQHIESGTIIDEQLFNFCDPADVAAAFAKYSTSITWAVTTDMYEPEQVTSGL